MLSSGISGRKASSSHSSAEQKEEMSGSTWTAGLPLQDVYVLAVQFSFNVVPIVVCSILNVA